MSKRMHVEGIAFEACELCGAEAWQLAYSGNVRNGAFGSSVPNAVVALCGGCGVERLAEVNCVQEELYKDDSYRRLLDEATGVSGFQEEHDPLQLRNLEAFWPRSLRNCTVADIGCAGGSMLDHVAGLAGRLVGVEPAENYHASLSARGCHVYPNVGQAAFSEEGAVDIAFCISVIEHVRDPAALLHDIATLLKPGGLLMVTTPNRNDVLMELIPDDYPAFFYRTVHRWYFTPDSLGTCAEAAGFEVDMLQSRHRFGLSNAMLWLRDRLPKGQNLLSGTIGPALDGMWKGYLEEQQKADYLYMICRKPEGGSAQGGGPSQ